jgi:hypothetical protein
MCGNTKNGGDNMSVRKGIDAMDEYFRGSKEWAEDVLVVDYDEGESDYEDNLDYEEEIDNNEETE